MTTQDELDVTRVGTDVRLTVGGCRPIACPTERPSDEKAVGRR